MNKLFVGRELRMVELKEKIKEKLLSVIVFMLILVNMIPVILTMLILQHIPVEVEQEPLICGIQAILVLVLVM